MQRTNFRQFTQTAMSDYDLRAAAPSIFATEPWHKMSDRYTFIPTINVVEAMRREGFVPYSAVQSNTRIEGKSAFTKHQIRFRDLRQENAVLTHLGQLFLEVIITNAHDGAAAYQIDGGLLRLACMNGMMVSDSTLQQVRARHTGNADGVINASYEVVEQFPKVLATVEDFARLQLAPPEREAFAKAALALKYDPENTPVSTEQVLRPMRTADHEPHLWNTLNVVQEKLLNGGGRGVNPVTQRKVTTRAVNGIGEATRLNKSLWLLADEMKKIKQAN